MSDSGTKAWGAFLNRTLAGISVNEFQEDVGIAFRPLLSWDEEDSSSIGIDGWHVRYQARGSNHERKVYANAQTAIDQLNRCGVLDSIVEGTIMLAPRPIGIKAWGAIDFLINRCKGYFGWAFSARGI